MTSKMYALFRAMAVTILAVCAGSHAVDAQTPSALDQVIKSKTLRVGWAVYYPYMFRDPKTQELTGITKDVIEEMAKALNNAKPEYVEDSWATIVGGLQANKYDITMPLAITLTRAIAVSYTAPMTKINFALAVRKEEVDQYKTWRDLDKADKTVSTVLGSSNTNLLFNFTSAKVSLLKDGPASAMAVMTRQADAWMNPKDALETALKQYQQLAIVPGPAIGHQEIAFAVRQGDFLMRDWVSLFVRELKASGKLKLMIAKYGLTDSDVAD